MYLVKLEYTDTGAASYQIVTEKVIASGMTYDTAIKIVDLLNQQSKPKTPTPLIPDQRVIQGIINCKLNQFMDAGCGAQATDTYGKKS